MTPTVDLAARVVFLPVRHHSPACAVQVDRVIREIKPAAVLIEGPRDATPLIPFLLHPGTKLPVAIYTTYVRRRANDLPSRHAAYYPLCDYSPELAAIRAAAEVGARSRFIDLTFPEMVTAEGARVDGKTRSLLDERYLRHSRFIRAACGRAGARDHDDLWDHLYEVPGKSLDPGPFFTNVLTYCSLAREEYTAEMLATDGTLAREAAMAAAIAEEPGRVVVVTGGYHTVALPRTAPGLPDPVKTAPADAQVVLMRYGFEQLDRLNGYASGMPSPEFYQHVWEGRNPAELIVELGRLARKKRQSTSVADEIACLAQARGLASLRGHRQLSREDLLDGIRSTFVKGAEDVEGVQIMAMTRKLFAGERIGEVPAEAGQPPLVNDFRLTAAALRVHLDRGTASELALDIYRKRAHREASRFFHRLEFLNVPFGHLIRGPDFVGGENLDRVQEVWKYQWSPSTESSLIERSMYGSSLEEAATALVLERFHENAAKGQGRRADAGARLLLEACRMGLHKHAQDLLDRTEGLIAEDASFISLIRTMEQLLLLQRSREPLEAHDLVGLTETAGAAYDRACYLVPSLASVGAFEEEQTIDAVNSFHEAVLQLGDTPERQELRWGRLLDLSRTVGGSSALRGAAMGSLFQENRISSEELIRSLSGHLTSTVGDGADGANYLRGLFRVARNVLWHVPETLDAIHALLREWSEPQFVKLIPTLRLAFADLTPRECDQVAGEVAQRLGVEAIRPLDLSDMTPADAARCLEVNRRVLATLAQDGLEAFVG